MNTKMKTLIKMTALGALMASTGTIAAVTPGLGGAAGKDATTTVTGVVPKMIRISGLDTLDLGTYDPSAGTDWSTTDDFCVWRNKTSGTYKIQMNGEGSGGAFEIADSAPTPNKLAFSVKFVDDSTGSLTALAPATDRTAQTANTASPTCASGIQARVEVTVAQAVAEAAVEGTYTGDLTVTVVPE
jgi:hypothetical protein